MLKPSLSVARPLSICLWLGSIAALGFWGCQGPDTFLRNGGNGGASGGHPSGGSSFGAGGRVGAGGTTVGSGGTSFGSGGSGAGGRAGAGGSATGGTTGGGGVTGTGGARDAGADMTTGAGGAIVDANRDSEGGIVSDGMGPCMGICAPATEFVSAPNYNSPNFPVSFAACYETTSNLQGGGCSNCQGRTVSVNGSPPASSWPSTLPAAVRGGYCIQVSAQGPDGGAVDFASFYTFSH
jgi:hypothetical protein